MGLVVTVGDDQIPSVQAVFAAVGQQVAGPEAAGVVGAAEEVGDAAAVDAVDRGGDERSAVGAGTGAIEGVVVHGPRSYRRRPGTLGGCHDVTAAPT